MNQAIHGWIVSVRTRMALALIFPLASACGKTSPAEPSVMPSASYQEHSAGTTEPTSPSFAEGPAAWSHLGNTLAWTKAVHSIVSRDLAKFEKARDREEFCPGYARATAAQKETCWVRLVSAVAELESDFNPNTTFHETFGVWSVGLLQLSAGECSNAPTIAALKDPVQNLLCGTAKMAALIARYGYVTTPDGKHGAAAYWSTLRGARKTQVARVSARYTQVAPVGAGWENVAATR